jgi:hypothetical protein
MNRFKMWGRRDGKRSALGSVGAGILILLAALLLIGPTISTAAMLLSAILIAAPAETPVPPAEEAIPLAPNPAHAFPGDALFYVECRHISDGLATLNQMAFWPEMAPLLKELSLAGGDPAAPLSVLASATDYWKTGAEFRRNMDTLCGLHLAVALIPSKGAGRPEPVVAAMGIGDGDPVAALAWLTGRITQTALTWTSPRGTDGYFVIRIDDEIKLAGQRVGPWAIFSTAASRPEMHRVAEALREGAEPIVNPLSVSEDYFQAMERLPEKYWARGYLNSAEMLTWITALQLVTGRSVGPLSIILSRMEHLGMAREVSPDRIRSRVTGRLIEAVPPDGLTRLRYALNPVGRRTATSLPGDALMAGDVGASPGEILAGIDWVLQASMPNFHEKLIGALQNFCSSTGLDPDTDFFPFVGNQTALAMLPAMNGVDSWPLQRPLITTEVFHRPKVERFLTDFVEWEAGAVAELSGGLVSAMVVSEEHEGTEILGLRLEGFIPLPLPSPSFAIIGNQLLASPVRSAVREAISAAHGTIPTLADRPGSWAADAIALPDAVEIFSLNFENCEHEWGLVEKIVLPFLPKPSKVVEEYKIADGGEEMDQHGLEALRSISRLLAQLGEMHGSATLDQDGSFVCLVENRPK